MQFAFFIQLCLICLPVTLAVKDWSIYPTPALRTKLYASQNLPPNEVLDLMKELVDRYDNEEYNDPFIDEEVAELKSLIDLSTAESGSYLIPYVVNEAIERHSEDKNIINYLVYQRVRLGRAPVTDIDVQKADQPTELMDLLFGPLDMGHEITLAIMKKLESLLSDGSLIKKKLRPLIDLGESEKLHCADLNQVDYPWNEVPHVTSYVKHHLDIRYLRCWTDWASKLMDVGQVEMSVEEVRDAIVKLRDLSRRIPSKIETTRLLDAIIYISDVQTVDNCLMARGLIELGKYKTGSNLHKFLQVMGDIYSINCNDDSTGFRIQSRFTPDLSSAQILGLLQDLDGTGVTTGHAWNLTPAKLIALSKPGQPSCENLKGLPDATVAKHSTLGSYLDEHLPGIFKHCHSELSRRLFEPGQSEEKLSKTIEMLDNLVAASKFTGSSTKDMVVKLTSFLSRPQRQSTCRQDLADFSAFQREFALPENCIASRHMRDYINQSAIYCAKDLDYKIQRSFLRDLNLNLRYAMSMVELDQNEKQVLQDILRLITSRPKQEKSWLTSSRKYQSAVRDELKQLITDPCRTIRTEQEAILEEAESFVKANPGVPDFHRVLETEQMLFCKRMMSLENELTSMIDALGKDAKPKFLGCFKCQEMDEQSTEK